MSPVLAADVANYLKQFYSERPDRKQTLMKHVGDYLAARVAAGKPTTHLSPHVAPIFFTTPISKFTDVAVKKGKKRPDSLYCSEAFRAVFFKGGGQHDQTDPDPVAKFQNLIRSLMPGYILILPYEYHFTKLISHGKHCLDLAFLIAVWRYCERVSPHYFPCPVVRVFLSVSTDKPLGDAAARATQQRARS